MPVGALTQVLGDYPRVQLLEALLRLGGLEFTRGELAREADLYRMTTNRQVEKLAKAGFIQKVSGGPRPKYRVRMDSPTLQVLSYLDAALGLLERDEEPLEPAELENIVEEYRRTVRSLVEPDAEPMFAGAANPSAETPGHRRRRDP